MLLTLKGVEGWGLWPQEASCQAPHILSLCQAYWWGRGLLAWALVENFGLQFLSRQGGKGVPTGMGISFRTAPRKVGQGFFSNWLT